MKNKSGLSGRLDTKAFTLIELLVVILIIGILAAVALPQYTQAVEKSRFATYRALANSMAQSAEAYYLANGIWPTSLDELTTELPADMSTQNEITDGVCRSNTKIFCCMMFPNGSSTAGTVRCGDNDYHLIYTHGYANVYGTPLKGITCQAKDEKYKAICKAISGGKDGTATATPTPGGWVSGYFYYEID